MRKNNYQIYLVLALGVMLLFAVPRRVQNALRTQFMRQVLPFGHMIPFKKQAPLPKNYPSRSLEANEHPFQLSSPYAHLAKILYRNPNTWSDFFWINLGKSSNSEKTIITLNSPVLYDGALVGIIDFVGDKQSRVQLITNSNLSISVRALRGKDQYPDLLNHVESLLSSPLTQSQESLLFELNRLKTSLLRESQNWHLAKGELYGASEPLWRSKSHILFGRGFNCEFGDHHGLQRDLVTGKSLTPLEIEIPILKQGDLLITTGLDGVFPEGLHVARVSEVDKLVEGAYAYSLKAHPLVSGLNDLRYVEVILPLGFQETKVSLRAFSD
ncbi:MAG: hypothetical protein S4CHLAM7_08130 [Chlamydiae bacterium]|nr:hypothetical protein [Chlamydiota bacterium]